MAEPRNPFGPNVLSFTPRSQPLGEGGGGFRPPSPMPQQALKSHIASQTKARGQPEVGFQERRAGQLADQRLQQRQEDVARARAEERRMDEAHGRAQAQTLAREQLADITAQRLNRPRAVTPEVKAEQGLRLSPATVTLTGNVQQYSRARDVSIFHDPSTGLTKLRRGSQAQEFGSRQEALEALGRGWPQGGVRSLGPTGENLRRQGFDPRTGERLPEPPKP